MVSHNWFIPPHLPKPNHSPPILDESPIDEKTKPIEEMIN
jgi:hypothetical protein